MASKTDYTTLQRQPERQWENERTARVDRLAEALAATRAAGRALPPGLTCGLLDLARAAKALRSELRTQLIATNPFIASPPDSRSELTELEELRRECDYDPAGDSPIGALIDYKDALEDRLLSHRRPHTQPRPVGGVSL